MKTTNMQNPAEYADVRHERWAWEWCGQDAIITHTDNQPPNVAVIHAETGTKAQVAARARLAAHAPELLEALNLMRTQFQYRDGDGAAKYHACNIAERVVRSALGLD